MASQFIRKLASLELEEKIFNTGALVALIGIFLPWIGGKLSLIDDKTTTYTGIGFYTAFIGMATAGLLLYLLAITVIPLMSGNQIIKRGHKDVVRLGISSLSTILILASLSVLMKVTFTSPGMEVRFGIYVALIGSMVATLYAYLAFQEHRKKEVHSLFHHEEEKMEIPELKRRDQPISPQQSMPTPPQSVTPPAPPMPEEHKLHLRG